MRILHFNQFRSHQGGVEGYIADVARALDRRGHSSHLISFTPDDPSELVADSTYVPLPDWPVSPDQSAYAIEVVIRQFKPDVAYIHAIYHPSLVAWLAQRLPTFAYIHGPYPVCPGSAQYLRRSSRACPHTAGAICLLNAQLERCCWGRHPLKHLRLLQRAREFKTAHRHIERVLVGSHFMQDLLQRGGWPGNRIVQLPPMLIESIPLAGPDPLEPPLILFAGRLSSEKGWRDLLHALAPITAAWRLAIAGDGPERAPCEALAQQLGFSQRVVFDGWLTPIKMEQRYHECALVAHPSRWPEPFGRIGPESFMHGKPVVAYAIGGIPDWLDDGVTGYLVEPGNITQLSQRLQTLIESREIRSRLGEQARQAAATRWNADEHVARLVRIFSDL